MRHVFILNPVAGKNQSALALKEKIDAYFADHPEVEYSIRLTDCVGAATRIAQEECEKRQCAAICLWWGWYITRNRLWHPGRSNGHRVDGHPLWFRQ